MKTIIVLFVISILISCNTNDNIECIDNSKQLIKDDWVLLDNGCQISFLEYYFATLGGQQFTYEAYKKELQKEFGSHLYATPQQILHDVWDHQKVDSISGHTFNINSDVNLYRDQNGFVHLIKGNTELTFPNCKWVLLTTSGYIGCKEIYHEGSIQDHFSKTIWKNL